jgi:thiol-disulfide isomerase/thioredoxin
VTKCTNQAVDEDIADAQPSSSNRKALLALRGAVVKAQVLCPFGGDGGGKGATKAEAKSFFDGFANAYDKLHGVKNDDAESMTKVGTQEETQPSQPAVETQPSQPAVDETQASQPAVATVATVATVGSTGAVQKVDRQSLTQLMEAHDQELLVVFYAPWCPHCQAFLLADQAPVDAIAQELAAAHGPKVVAFDTTASSMPAGFDANFIPTIMLVSKDGRKSEFLEDPTEVEHLKAFALAGV